DPTGDFDKNLKLSQDRAEAVVQYLTVKHRIPLRRIMVPIGYGETKLLDTSTTASGLAKNRRVEVRVMVNKASVSSQYSADTSDRRPPPEATRRGPIRERLGERPTPGIQNCSPSGSSSRRSTGSPNACPEQVATIRGMQRMPESGLRPDQVRQAS